MLYYKYFFMILAFAVLLVGCGENPLDGSKDFNPQMKIELPKEIIGSDGASMALIPAGEFQMGSDENESEKPVHTVYLDSFYMDKYEVTNAQYRKFVQATGWKEPGVFTGLEVSGISIDGYRLWEDKNSNGDDQPIIFVSWEDANAYAKWVGKRLPNKAEWEKAARGGLVGKRYVWGDEWPPPPGAGNFRDESYHKLDSDDNKYFIPGYDDGYTYTAPVGSFNPNGYGLYDMVGNVAEWCGDDDLYMSSASSFRWGTNNEDRSLWVASYFFPTSTTDSSSMSAYDVGFRCAMDAK